MSDLWIPVIAALGASLLTGTFTFGLERWRLAKVGKLAQSERRNRAYSLLLTRSAVILLTAFGLHATMEIRSGLREAVNVGTRNWKTLDPLEFNDRLRTDLQPLYEAL